MASIFNDDDLSKYHCLKGSVCALGVFDGVHLGHMQVIDSVLAEAASTGADSAIITFNPDPDELFMKESLMKLMSNERRIEELASLDVDHVAVLSFTPEFASLEPDAFLEKVFGKNTPSVIHVGSDLRFGSKAKGSVDDLIAWGDEHGMKVVSHELFEMDGLPVKSSRIRKEIDAGNIAMAERLLGHAYEMSS